MKRRLHEPPLPQPEVAFAREQPLAKNMPVRLEHAPLDVTTRMSDKHFFDEVGMIDKNIAKIDHADARDVPVVARQLAEHFQRAFVQRLERPAFEPFEGAGREFVAARPHSIILGRAFPRVNAGE